jgi:hypothetical protein
MEQVHTDKKTSILTNLIAAVCIIIYIVALSYGALKIYNSIQERLAIGEQEYTNLADLASAAGVLGFMNEPFIRTIDDTIASSRSILGVIITGPNGEYAFERNKGTVITWVNNSPRFKHPFGVSDPPHYMPLRIEGQRNVSIQVATGYVDYEFCIDILKKVLLVVLASLTLAFFILLMETLLVKNRTATSDGMPTSGKEDQDASGAEADKEDEMSDDNFADIEDSTNQSTGSQDDELSGGEDPMEAESADEEASPEEIDEESAGKVSPEVADEDFSDIDFSFIDDPPAEPASSVQKQPEPVKQKPPAGVPKAVPGDEETAAIRDFPPEIPAKPPAKTEPRGLFSPRGNIGWEEYTIERLEAELRRCVSGEQDLVFINMEFKDTGVLDAGGIDSDQFYVQFASDAVDFFIERDLIFEKGERGISIILPNVDLEQGFTKSQEFYNRILSKHSEVFSSKSDVCIGLSSRSGRLIDTERLMFETSQALKKAIHDPVSCIIAFKSDPEKYREFINNRK